MSYKADLMLLEKEELADMILTIIGDYRYSKEVKKLPFEYCPVCNRRLKVIP